MNNILIDILKNFDPQNPTFRPTEIYNEGWLLKILLNEYSKPENREGLLKFSEGATWFSESMLPTKFTARKRGDNKAESRTNADGVIGHIKVGDEGKADLKLTDNAKQFDVIEAKMNSKLTKNVKNSPTYDQAARTVACMAETLDRNEIQPNTLNSLAYIVLAPEKHIDKNNFMELVTNDAIRKKVEERVNGYKNDDDYQIYKNWFEERFVPALDKTKLEVLSWESVIEQLPGGRKKEIREFYDKCLEYN